MTTPFTCLPIWQDWFQTSSLTVLSDEYSCLEEQYTFRDDAQRYDDGLTGDSMSFR